MSPTLSLGVARYRVDALYSQSNMTVTTTSLENINLVSVGIQNQTKVSCHPPLPCQFPHLPCAPRPSSPNLGPKGRCVNALRTDQQHPFETYYKRMYKLSVGDMSQLGNCKLRS
eukprot:9478409-Pyramimonas_sp.AAC.6